MSVTLVDRLLAVGSKSFRACLERDRLGAEAHRATHVAHVFLLWQQVDNRGGRLGVELGRVRSRHARYVTCELGNRDLHTEADTEEWHLMLARKAGRSNLAFNTAATKATGDQHAID